MHSLSTTYADTLRREAWPNAWARHAHWLLRLALASVFLFHGVGKFAGLAGFAEMMDLSWTVALLVALAEVGGGIAIVAGYWAGAWLTRVGAAVMVPVLLGAIVLVHWGQWSFVASPTHPMGGMEFQVVLTLLAGYLLLRGNDA